MSSTSHPTDTAAWWPNLLSPPVAGVVALLLVYLGIWMLVTPYAGLSHDAQAYAFQALARLDPAGLGQDIFLRYESQDRYTVFPTVLAALSQPFGVETTAAMLTLFCHVAWYGVAYLLCRRLFGSPLALLSLGLLVAFPGAYGGHRIFHVAEPFLTARLPAEVVVLIALACWHSGRRVVAGLILLAGLAIHPLMAFPAFLLLCVLYAEQRRPGQSTLPLGAALVIPLAIAGSAILGGTSAVMTEHWLEVAHLRSSHLFLEYWSPGDWNLTLLPLLTLGVAGLLLPDSAARSQVRAVLWIGIAGLVLAAICADLWHSKILLQGQPWRWMWLARVTAIAALPATILVSWRLGSAGRAIGLLIMAGWLIVLPVAARGLLSSVMGSILAASALTLAATYTRMTDSTATLVRRGASVIFILVLGAALTTASLRWMTFYGDVGLSHSMQRLVMLAALVTPAAMLVVACWSAVYVWRRPVAVVVVALFGIGLVAAASTFAVPRWQERTYSGENLEKFSAWRERIPRNAEVFWWDGLREVWFLLQRKSYLTSSQGGGVVFSPALTAELQRRAENVSAFIDPGYFFNEPTALRASPRPLNAEMLASMCRDPQLGFVVGRDSVGSSASPIDWPAVGEPIYLYDCNDYRREGAT